MSTREEGISFEGSNQVIITRELAAREAEDAAMLKRNAVDSFIKLALKRFDTAFEAEKPQRAKAMESVEFNSGKHWDRDIRKAREAEQKVVIEINRTPQFLKQVANDEKQLRPKIVIKATGYGNDPDVANVKGGIIKSAERRSGAEGIRDDAFYRMLEKGFAYWRVNYRYSGQRSWKQHIYTDPIENDFSVYADPSNEDMRHKNYLFITDNMPIEEYKNKYKNSQMAALTDYDLVGDADQNWVGVDGTIKVCEYMYIDEVPMLLYAFPSNDPMRPEAYIGKFEDEIEEGSMAGCVRDETGEPITRKEMKRTCMWAKINAIEVLEGNADKTAGRKLHSGTIPVVKLTGERRFIDGRHIYVGMVEDAKEPVRASDYWLSAITEMVALGPKAPWVVSAKSVANYQHMWDTANISNWSALYYDHIDEAGNPLPAPQRNFGEPPIQAATFILRYADEDLKRVMGIYSAALGAPGPETSGVAIDSRKSESQNANFNYTDNLKRSIRYEAELYLDIMPHIYDDPQMAEITKPDGSVEHIQINKEFGDEGAKKKYLIEHSDESVDITVAPALDTQRQEAAQGMSRYLELDPGAAPLVGDLIARNQDFPDKDEFERRLRHRVPAEVLQGSGVTDVNNIPPAYRSQYETIAKMLEETTAALQGLQGKIDQDAFKMAHEKELKEMELASQERIASLTLEGKMADIASKTDLNVLKLIVEDVRAEIEAIRQPGSVESKTVAPQ